MKVAQYFEQQFGESPAVSAAASGRVNLLGEHTDYNDGFVLPATLPLLTQVAIGPSRDGRFQFASRDIGHGRERVDIAAGAEAPEGYARYVLGCFKVLGRMGIAAEPCNVAIQSDVPIGAGLSSSAALDVAMLRALRQMLAIEIDDVTIAKLAQRVEIEYAGVNCGIMDQMAVSVGHAGELLFLDTRSLETRRVPFPAGSAIAVLDCGVPRTLATSGYNQRRAECEAAAAALGVSSLRDVDDIAAVESLPEPLRRRARHVLNENRRVLAAADGVDACRFGQLMLESHASLRDDFEVSIAALDVLVECLQAQDGVYGCKLTGAGFGGACVALVETARGPQVKPAALAEFARRGYSGKVLY